jgi:hypothetical protein
VVGGTMVFLVSISRLTGVGAAVRGGAQ